MKLLVFSTLIIGVSLAYQHKQKPLAGLTCECGWRNGEGEGDRRAAKNEYPWIAEVSTLDDLISLCSATIVTKWHAISSASCTKHERPSEIVLCVGAVDITLCESEANAKIYNVDDIKVHESYEYSSMANDISIIVTSTEIEFNQFVGPACFQGNIPVKNLKDQKVKTMGWGDVTVDFLQKVDLQVIKQEKCTEVFTKTKGQGTHICVEYEGDTCPADYGSPLMWNDPVVNRYFLVGLVSYIYPDCKNTDEPIFNTFLPHHAKWISEKIAGKVGAKICEKA